MASKTLQIIIEAKDNASKTLKGMNKSFKDSGLSLEKFSKNAKLAGTAITGVGALMAGKAIKSAVTFEKAMSNVNTLFDDSGESAKELEKGIKKLLKSTPKNAEELGASAYSIVSAGIGDATDALEVLNNTQRLAVAGLGTTSEATDIVTSAINAFGKEVSDADDISNSFFLAVKSGKTTVTELAQGFGQVAPLANEMNVKFEDLLSSTSAMTTSGMKASIAYTQIRAALSNLAKPTREMQEAMDVLGVSSFDAMLANDGLVGTFKKLKDTADDNNISLAKMFGSVEGLNAMLMLTGDTGENATKIMGDMENSTNSLTVAYDKQLKTMDSQYNILKNNLNVAMIDLGSQILPLIIPLVQKLTELIGGVSTKTLKWVTATTLVIGPLLILLGFLPSIIAGIKAVSLAILILNKAFLSLAANPIVLAIASVILLAVLIIKYWDEIKAATIATWGYISNLLIATWNIIKSVSQTIWDGITNYFTKVFEIIKKIFKTTINFIVGLMETFLNWLNTDTLTYLESLKEIISNILRAIQTIWNTIWTAIKEFFQGMWNLIIGILSTIGKVISTIFNTAKQGIINAWSFIWEGVLNQTTSFIEMIKAPIKEVLTWIQDKIDSVLGAYSSAKAKVSNFFGGMVSKGREITGFADGGIVTKPTLGLVGEAGPEAIIPLNKLKNNTRGGGITIIINGDVSGQDLVDKVKQNIMGDLALNNNLG